MKISVQLSCIAATLLFAPLLLWGDGSNSDGLVFFDALSFAGAGDSARLDLYLAVPYSALAFKRSDDGNYNGRYRARITVTDTDDRALLFDSTFTRSVHTSSYTNITGETTAFEFFQQRMTVPPGEYEAKVEILDYETHLTSDESRIVTVIDFPSYPFSISGLMLVSKIKERDAGHSITPLLTENVSLLEDYYFVFFETYNFSDEESFNFAVSYKDAAGEVVKNEYFDKAIPKGQSQQWIRLPLEGIGRGSYVLEVTASSQVDKETILAVSKRVVRFKGAGMGMPLSEAELEEKITRLRFAATQSELDYIKDAELFPERRERYAEFWQRKDPSPGTLRNEAMDEYFRRIEHSNKNFRGLAEGWLTDMGRIYVIYGPPDRVDRDPFRSDGKPRETWEYFSRRLRLIFIDETGFGDFRLATPVSFSEKYQY